MKHLTKTHQREALATRGPPTYELGRYPKILFRFFCNLIHNQKFGGNEAGAGMEAHMK